MNQITIFSPASVSNLCCGFDVLGFSIDSIGDELTITKSANKGVNIKEIKGYNVPLENNKNTASVAAQALLDHLKINEGFDIEINKKIKPGSGIGSSAASAAGSVFAINELMGRPLKNKELIKYAAEGEKIACGTPIYDNVAAVLLGGFTLVREKNDILKLNSPNELAFTILHPQIEIKTSASRALVKNEVSIEKMVKQSANLGAFVSGLYKEDFNLIGRSMKDLIIEPFRSNLIPDFKMLKKISYSNGALSFGISGSGPSVFALCRGIKKAKEIGDLLKKRYNQSNIDFEIHTSLVNQIGIKIISTS